MPRSAKGGIKLNFFGHYFDLSLILIYDFILMTKKSLVISAIVVILGYIGLKAYQVFKSIDVQFTSIKVSDLFSSPKLYASFRIVNQSSLQATIESITGAIYYNGKYLADVSSQAPIIIENNVTTFEDIKIDSSLSPVVNFIGQYLNNSNIVYTFEGHIKVMGLSFPISQTLQS
jgi:LEA14-like dessication related protein